MIDLRLVLRLDAAASGGLGLLLLLLSGPADDRLGIPAAVSFTVGGLLLVWAACVAWVASRPTPALVRAVAALNLGYVGLSVVFALGDLVRLTDLGVAFVLAQAAAVLVLATAQLSLRPQPTTQVSQSVS